MMLAIIVRMIVVMATTVIAVGMIVVVFVAVISLMIPTGAAIPVRVVAAPVRVALFRMAVTIAEVRMIGWMVITILITISIAHARSQHEESGQSERGG